MRFEPDDPVLKRSWLFSNHCSFPEGGGASRGRKREEAIGRARIKAVEELFNQGGPPMILELACQVEHAHSLGWALANSSVFDSQEALLLSQGLGSTEAARRDAFASLLHGRAAIKGQEWLEGLRSCEIWNKWTLQQRADYYIRLPFDGNTWDALEKEKAEIQRLYWLNICINGCGNMEPKDCERLTLKLIENGRLETAVDFVALYRKKLLQSPQLVAEVLDRAIRGENTEKGNWGSLAYEVGELLDLLEESGKIGTNQLAQFECYFLPLLRNYGRPPKILHKALTDDPAFFAEVMKWPYRAKGEEPSEPSEEKSIRARLGFDLLQSWERPPGVNEDGSVDPEKLRSWVNRAHELAQSNGRGDIADHHIGQVLVHYPSGADGAWPHKALRDLIEDLRCEEIEKGIVNGIYNGRGVVSRSIGEGGDQERVIAERYLNYARILSDNWPRTARLMKKIANVYESEARREDGRAELDEDLYR